MGESPAGRRRYTVREASELLRISQHAIRQRIRRNTLGSEKSAEGRVYVLLGLDEEVSGEPSDKASEEHKEASGVDPVQQMLREQNQMLREQLDEAHAANRENRRIIAALTQRIPEIEPPREAELPPEPRDAPESTTETGPPTETPASDAGQSHAPWWRRFFGFE